MPARFDAGSLPKVPPAAAQLRHADPVAGGVEATAGSRSDAVHGGQPQAGAPAPLADGFDAARPFPKEGLGSAQPALPSSASPDSRSRAELQHAASLDAAQVAKALSSGLEDGCRHLEQRLAECSDPAYRVALVEACSDSIAAVARALASKLPIATACAVASSLTRVAEAGGRETAEALALAFASGIEDGPVGREDPSALGGALEQAILAGHGGIFSTEVAAALEFQGKTKASCELERVCCAGLAGLRDRFEDCQHRVDQLNETLGTFSMGFGTLLGSEKLEKALANFKSRHAQEYEAWERAGQLLASAIPGAADVLSYPIPTALPVPILGAAPRVEYDQASMALHVEADTILRLLPALAHTTAGLELLVEGLETKGRGEPGFLDELESFGARSEANRKAVEDLEPELVRATAHRAVETALDGGDFHFAYRGLKSTASNVGDEQLMSMLVDAADTDGEPFGLWTLFEELNHHLLHLDVDGATNLVRSVKGLSLAFGIRGLIREAKEWNELDDAHRTKLVGEVLETSVGGGEYILDIVGQAQRFAGVGAAIERLHPIGALVASAGEGMLAARNFDHGETAEGFARAATAIGNTLIAVPVPAVQFVAGAMVFGGAATRFALGRLEERGYEADLGAFLVAGGVPAPLAERLDDLSKRATVGPVLAETAQLLGVPPAEFLDSMASWPEPILERVVKTASKGREKEKTPERLAAYIRDAGLPYC